MQVRDEESVSQRCIDRILPTRYIFTGLISAGLAIIYGLKVSMSVAIVVMINSTALLLEQLEERALTTPSNLINQSQISNDIPHHQPILACPTLGNVNHLNASKLASRNAQQDGPFVWSEPTQGLVLGAYFWGYILTQIPGGRMAEMYSAKLVFWGSVMINALFTILTPLAANLSYIAVLVVRFVEGLSAGVSLPATHVMLSKWALPEERNAISSFTFSGMAMGTLIALPLSGFLADHLGWEGVFYVQGGLALVWCVLWSYLVYDSPQDHPRIGAKELELFELTMAGGTCHQERVNLPVPWKAIFLSGPFWAILIAHTCSNFGWYMLLVELPTYMRNILRFRITKNSILSAVPYLSMWIYSIIWSRGLDWIKSRGWINNTNARILSTGMASFLPAVCFIGVSLAGCDRATAVALMTLAATFMAGKYCGFLTNHIDIASNYAGTLMGLTNTVASVPGFLVPVFVGELTHGNQSLGQWQIIFFTTAAIMLLECVVYAFLASGNEQPWNRLYLNPTKEVVEKDDIAGTSIAAIPIEMTSV